MTCGLSYVQLVSGDVRIEFDYGMLSPTSKEHSYYQLHISYMFSSNMTGIPLELKILKLYRNFTFRSAVRLKASLPAKQAHILSK